MLKRLLGVLGLSAAEAPDIGERVKFCGALAESFADRLPRQFHNNLAVTAAWWSVALYVQLATRPGKRLDDDGWETSAGTAADLIMARLFPEFPPSEPEQRKLRHAMAQHVLGTCKLWIAYFGAAPDPDRFQDPRSLGEELLRLFDDESLELRESLWLPEKGDEGMGEDGTDEANHEDLCEGFALFFDICSRSHP